MMATSEETQHQIGGQEHRSRLHWPFKRTQLIVCLDTPPHFKGDSQRLLPHGLQRPDPRLRRYSRRRCHDERHLQLPRQNQPNHRWGWRRDCFRWRLSHRGWPLLAVAQVWSRSRPSSRDRSCDAQRRDRNGQRVPQQRALLGSTGSKSKPPSLPQKPNPF